MSKCIGGVVNDSLGDLLAYSPGKSFGNRAERSIRLLLLLLLYSLLNLIPLRAETGLAYNRFRYYSPETGAYISQDPIRLEAGLTNLYAYVHDTNAWVDPWGLATVYLRNKEYYVGKAKHSAKVRYGNVHKATDIFTDMPNTDIAQGVEQLVYERLNFLYSQKITNINRPVNMDDKKKIWRYEEGKKWLTEKYGSNYNDIIDQRIQSHYH